MQENHVARPEWAQVSEDAVRRGVGAPVGGIQCPEPWFEPQRLRHQGAARVPMPFGWAICPDAGPRDSLDRTAPTAAIAKLPRPGELGELRMRPGVRAQS